MQLTTILLTAFFIISFSLNSFANGLGPFNIPPIGSNEIFREVPAFISPTDHKEKKIQVNFSARCLNIWAYNIESDNENPDEEKQPEYGSFLLDMESYSINPRISFKASENIRFEAIIPLIYQTGGFLDGAIEKFHDTLSLGQHHRTDLSRNAIRFLYIATDGETLVYYKENDLKGLFIGNITIATSYQAKNLPLPASIRLLLTFPTSTMPVSFDGGSYNTTLQTTFSWTKASFIGYHGIGFTVFSNNEANGINLKKRRFSFLNTIEYQKSSSFSIIMHIVSATPVADYPKLDEPIVEITMGFKKKIGKGIFELGVIENLFFFDNSPDIGIHMGYSIRIF